MIVSPSTVLYGLAVSRAMHTKNLYSEYGYIRPNLIPTAGGYRSCII